MPLPAPVHITILIPDPIREGSAKWLKCHFLLEEHIPTYLKWLRNHINWSSNCDTGINILQLTDLWGGSLYQREMEK